MTDREGYYQPDAEKLRTPGDGQPAPETVEAVNETTASSEPMADEGAPTSPDEPVVEEPEESNEE